MTGKANHLARARPLALALVLSGTAVATPLAAEDTASADAIRNRLLGWTQAFNARDSGRICDLFAPDLVAVYQGAPTKDFDALCGDLRRVLARDTPRMRYRPEIEEIIISDDLAVVRLRWHLTIEAATGGTPQTIQEISLDIFRRQSDSLWRISRFVAYEDK